MPQVAQFFAPAALALVCLAAIGCNTPSLGEANAAKGIEYRKISDRHGNPKGTHGEYILNQRVESFDTAPAHSYSITDERPLSLSSVWVAEHPTDPKKLIQAGWLQSWATKDGSKTYRIMDNRWDLVANLNQLGFLYSPDGRQAWGGRAFDLQDAAKAVFGAGAVIHMDVAAYDLTTTLVFRSGAQFSDESPANRGAKVNKAGEVASLRPMNAGELQRAADALSPAKFYETEQHRYRLLREERNKRAESIVPKPRANEE